MDYNIVFVSSAAFYGGIGGALVIHLTFGMVGLSLVVQLLLWTLLLYRDVGALDQAKYLKPFQLIC